MRGCALRSMGMLPITQVKSPAREVALLLPVTPAHPKLSPSEVSLARSWRAWASFEAYSADRMMVRNAARAMSFFEALGCLALTASIRAFGFILRTASSLIVSEMVSVSRSFVSPIGTPCVDVQHSYPRYMRFVISACWTGGRIWLNKCWPSSRDLIVGVRRPSAISLVIGGERRLGWAPRKSTRTDICCLSR